MDRSTQAMMAFALTFPDAARKFLLSESEVERADIMRSVLPGIADESPLTPDAMLKALREVS